MILLSLSLYADGTVCQDKIFKINQTNSKSIKQIVGYDHNLPKIQNKCADLGAFRQGENKLKPSISVDFALEKIVDFV